MIGFLICDRLVLLQFDFLNQNKNINKLIYSRLEKNKTTFATLL